MEQREKELFSILLGVTPTSWLHYYATRRGQKPSYEWFETQGDTQGFCVMVSVGQLSGIGYGRSKKVAKHAAALLLMSRLLNGSRDNAEAIMLPEPEILNPVGDLQEMCLAKKWALPKYLLVSEQWPLHAIVFTISVEVLHFEAIGSERSKKLARKQAAFIMLRVLSESDVDSSSSCDLVLAGVVRSNHVKKLEMFGDRWCFEIVYKHIKDAPRALFEYLVYATSPTEHTVVRSGKGISHEMAMDDAAMKMLQYLASFLRQQRM